MYVYVCARVYECAHARAQTFCWHQIMLIFLFSHHEKVITEPGWVDLLLR